MSYRIDKVSVELEIYEEFEGRRNIKFSYVPHAEDALTKLLLERNQQLIDAGVAANPPTMGDLFIG